MKTTHTFKNCILHFVKPVYIFLLILLFNAGIRQAFSQDFWQQTDMPPHLSIYALGADDAGNIYAGGYGQGLFKSSDHGDTWAPSGMDGYWIRSISMNNTGDIFLAGVGDAYGSGIFKSSDQGATWTKVFGFDDDYAGFNCVYVAPDNSIWTGLNYSSAHNGIYRSTDDGATWDSVFSDLKNFNAIVATAAGKVFAGSYGRIYYSLDNGSTWSYSEEGLVPSKITALAANNSGQVFAATAGYGIYRTDNDGASWVSMENSGPDYSCLLIDSEQHIYTGTQGYWVYRSMDNGDNWELINSGLTNKYILSLTMDKDGYLYAGTDTSGVFRSNQKVISGIQPQEDNDFTFSVYPNPASDRITVDIKKDYSFELVDLSGRVVLRSNRPEADVSHLPGGMYLLRIKDHSHRTLACQKMIIR